MAVSRMLFLAAIAVLLLCLSVAQSPPTPPALSPSPANPPTPEASASAPVIPPLVTLLTLLPPAIALCPSTFTSPPSPPASMTTASTTISLPPLATSSPPIEGSVIPEAPSSGTVANKFALSRVLAAGFAAALAM